MNLETRTLLPRLAIAWLVLTFQAEADSVRGTVLDPDGQPVAGAELRLLDRTGASERSISSARDGSYAFDGVPPGDYLLEGDAASTTLTGSRSLALDGDQTLDLMLTLSATNVEVTVTASGTPLQVEEIAKAVDVVDRDELVLRNAGSIAAAVGNLPGVRVQQLRGPGGLTTIQSRGLRNRDTALLIDGMRFRDAASINGDATAFFADMTSSGTERIELLRGSGSSIYGSHAVGGVVNLTPHREGGPPHGELQIEGGGLGMRRAVSGLAGGFDRERLTYSGSLTYTDVGNGARKASPYRNTGLKTYIGYHVQPGISLGGHLWWSDASAALGESPALTPQLAANFPSTGPVPGRPLPLEEIQRYEQGLAFEAGEATFMPDQIDPDNRRESSFLTGGFNLSHQLSPEGSYRIAYQGVDTNRLFLDGPLGPNTFDSSVNSRDDGRIDTLQARTDHRAGDHNLVTIGYEFERESYTNVSTEELPSFTVGESRVRQRSHAVFAQDQIRILDGRLQLALSGRLASFKLEVPRFSGTSNPYDESGSTSPPSAFTADAALAYFLPGTQTKLRIHAGNSYRSPSAFERFGASFFFGAFTYFGDPRLSPERSLGVDAGLDQWLLDSKLQLTGTIFYTELEETILFDSSIDPGTDPFGRVFGGYRNGGGGIARGVEVGGRLTPRAGTSLRVAYTYTNSDSNTPTIGSDFFEIPGVSDHTLSVTASHWFGSRWNATMSLFAAGDYSMASPFLFGSPTRQMVMDGPVKTDLVVRYDWPVTDAQDLEIYTGIENVLNAEYYEDGFRAPGRWATVGLRFEY